MIEYIVQVFVVIVTVLCTLWWNGFWNKPNHIPSAVEDTARSIMAIIDAGLVPEEGVLEARIAKSRKRPARLLFIGTCVNEAKNKFGLMRRTIPNHRMVSKFLNEKMIDRGMHPGHISQMLPLAIEAVFVPTEMDIVCSQFRASAEVLLRESQMSTKWESKETRLKAGPGFTHV
jgi:hypothetical protein